MALNKQVHDIMAREVVTLKSSDKLDVAKNMVNSGRIRHFPVVERGYVVGVASQRDILNASVSSVVERFGERGQRIQQMFLSTIAVKDVMAQPPITIAPEASISDAARLMTTHTIGCLPVISDGILVGLVTATDILNTVAQM
jgi:CBS domain-containing protein